MRLGNVPVMRRTLFSGTAISVNGYLSQVPRRGRLSHYRFSECVMEV
jgi:primosomal replication protein N